MSLTVLPPRLITKIAIAEDTQCWVWKGSTNAKKYGRLGWKGANRYAHRIVYELIVGEIPEGLVLDHTCKNPSCVNPEHLRPITQKENTAIGESPSARHARKTHCPARHDYAEYGAVYRQGKNSKQKHRVFLMCARERWRLKNDYYAGR